MTRSITIFLACFALALPVTSSFAATQKRAKKQHTAVPVAASTKKATAFTNYAGSAEALLLAEQIAKNSNLDVLWVRAQMAEAKHLPRVVQLMNPSLPRADGAPKPKGNWEAYRRKFLTPAYIQAGVAFWHTHRADMARAEAEYGVPAHIIAGILGVETIYGRNVGSFRVLDALVTLALDYPIHHPRREARVAYFRGEVENFLILAQQLGRDPASFKGSFAGAMGLPQFMPSSWRKFAVDFDADGRIDLWSSPSDAIGSIASYFKGYGWQSGLATHISLPSSALSSAALSSPPHSPNQSPTLPAGFTLLELENGELEPTRLGVSPNFFVITKYNNSYNYAAAVIELGAAVSEAYHSK